MLKSTFIFCLALLSETFVWSQDYKGHKVWATSRQTYIDFRGAWPVSGPAAMSQLQGVASVCGADGNLLFYTDGTTIWNSRNQVMPNGAKIQPFSTRSSSQSAVIIPMPDSAKYFVFSLTEIDEGRGGRPGEIGGNLYYSVVNMDLDNGSGDVEVERKGIPIEEKLSEKMIAVRGDNCNVWLVVHSRNESLFKSYEITHKGFNPVPVISRSGPVPPVINPGEHGADYFYYHGKMKISPDRKKLALGNYHVSYRIELHDFDPATGRVFNGAVLGKTGEGAYGICFSPDNSKLYSVNDVGVKQFDLSLPDIAAVNSNAVQLTMPMYLGYFDLGLAPDDKIYWGAGVDNFLFSIDEPNKKGEDCNITYQFFQFYGPMQGTFWELPPPVVMMKAYDTVKTSRSSQGCFNGSVTLRVPGRDHVWDNGLTRSYRTVDKPGRYVVKYMEYPCTYHIDTIVVPELPRLYYPVNCSSADARVEVSPDNTISYTYTWYNASGQLLQLHTGSKGDTLAALQTSGYSVRLQSGNGCDTSFSFNAVPAPRVSIQASRDTICEGDTIYFQSIANMPASGYYWKLDDSKVAVTASPFHKYTVAGSFTIQHSIKGINGCSSDTVKLPVKVYAMPKINAGPDVSILAGEKLTINAVADQKNFRFQWYPVTGLTDPFVLTPVAMPATTTTYQLTASNKEKCVATDEVTVTVLAKITVPNAFSPNGDGLHDTWEIPGLDTYRDGAEIYVFNRWGQRVFYSSRYTKPWDGTFNGKLLPAATYYYMISFNTGQPRQLGTLTIIR